MELMGFEGWRMIIPIIVAAIVLGVIHLIAHPRDAVHAKDVSQKSHNTQHLNTLRNE